MKLILNCLSEAKLQYRIVYCLTCMDINNLDSTIKVRWVKLILFVLLRELDYHTLHCLSCTVLV